METLDRNNLPQDVIATYRQDRLRACLLPVVLGGLAVFFFFGPFSEIPFFWLMGMVFAVIALFSLRPALHSFRSSNWLFQIHQQGLCIQSQVYPQVHLSHATKNIFFFDFDEIVKVRPYRTRLGDEQLVLQLAPGIINIIAEFLRDETRLVREETGKKRVHVPLRVDSEKDELRVLWSDQLEYTRPSLASAVARLSEIIPEKVQQR